jgi:AcrR family transcriptional regulator
MSSNKSRPQKHRIALTPQRSHGKLRVAALLEAGASVIAEKGFQSATMAEIASRAGAPIGSLYRFFPNKEILADALIQRFATLVEEAFVKINSRIKTLSLADLSTEFLSLMTNLEGERLVAQALLESHADWSAKRIQFRRAFLGHITQTLRLRCPRLNAKVAGNVAVIILHNMKMGDALNTQLKGGARNAALAELHEMTCLYLAAKLK